MTGVKDGNVRKDTIVAKDVNVPNVVNHGLKGRRTIRKPVVRNNGYEVIYRRVSKKAKYPFVESDI